jgi:Ni/Co efflux regulator RcnB
VTTRRGTGSSGRIGKLVEAGTPARPFAWTKTSTKSSPKADRKKTSVTEQYRRVNLHWPHRGGADSGHFAT